MSYTIKRRQGEQRPRWRVLQDGKLLGYGETYEAAEALVTVHRDRDVLLWALAAGANVVSWDEAARRAGYKEGATWAFKERVKTLMPFVG